MGPELLSKEAGRRMVIVNLKHTQQVFLPHKETFYRDNASRRNNLENLEGKPTQSNLKKFWARRYYLFSKFDKGIKIDEESWYSVTPEPMAKHIAQRVVDALSSDQGSSQVSESKGQSWPAAKLCVLDAFCGVGGNMIQFARKCGYCVASDLDLQKLQYAQHNAQVYNLQEPADLHLIHEDYLRLPSEAKLKKGAGLDFQKINAVFLSPPWGGTGYQNLEEYSLEHIFPEFDRIVAKSVEYSPNLLLFLPKNTSISELIQRLLPFAQ